MRASDLFDQSGLVGALTLKKSRSTESGVAILNYVPRYDQEPIPSVQSTRPSTNLNVTVLDRGTMMVR
jgi:hypothetical protein